MLKFMKEYEIPGKLIKEGQWEDFFDFELPILFYEREKSHRYEMSIDYPSEEEYKFPNAVFEICIYNPPAENFKVLKAKLYFEKIDEFDIIETKRESYLKYSEVSLVEREVLDSLGEQIKITVYKNRRTKLEIKTPSNFNFVPVFSFFQNKIKENIPSMEKWLIEQLREDEIRINEYITLKLEHGQCAVYNKGERFWTFFKEDTRRNGPVELYELTIPYEEWFRTKYFSQADDKFQSTELEFSDCCRLFQLWNENNYKNNHFTWHFYSHLMDKLIKAGVPNAKSIYIEEIGKKDREDLLLLKKKEERKTTSKGVFKDWFDFDIPDKILINEELEISSSREYPYIKEKLIPRSSIDITIYLPKQPSDRLFKVKYYLERTDEMREIEYEKATYFKYWEFMEQRKSILKTLGEEIKVITLLDETTFISFSNLDYIPKEIIFPEFKEKLARLFNNY